MRFLPSLRVLTLASLAASAACAGEGPSAAVAPTVDVAGPALSKGSSTRGGDLTEVITVDPTRTRVYHIGQNWVYIPAYAVCDAGSTYGPTEWDRPCDRAREPFELTVSIGEDHHGRPTARFTPDLRFAPSSQPYRWVVMGLKVKGKLEDAAGYGILYQPTGSSEWVDESLTDPTLRAWRAKGNVVARRLKHFSGYNVSLGFQEQSAQLDFGFRMGEAY